MKTSLTKSVILSSTLLLSLTVLSSCGKSKEVKSQPPTAEITQAPPVASETLPTPDAQNDTLTPNGQTRVPPPGRGTLGLPPTSTPDVLPTPGDDFPVEPLTNPQAELPTPGRGSKLPTPLEMLSSEPTRAYQVDFKGQAAVKTGGQSKGLSYTSTGDDGLMTEFKTYNSKVSAEQQKWNNNLAKGIVNAKLSRTSDEMTVTLTIDEDGPINTYRMIAKSDGDKMKLTMAKMGVPGQLEFQGGFLKCLDADGGCDTAYAKVKFSSGYARVIFRNSNSDVHFLVQDNISNNANFTAMSRYVLNAANNLNTTEKFQAMKLSSYEVVNGSSAMGALITTEDRQMIGLEIPMLVGGVNSEVNTAATKTADLSKSFDLPRLTTSHGINLFDKINGVRLVNNNGRGQFKVQLQLGSELSPASIWFVATRFGKETITIDQIRAFESTLQAF